jgi:hypothetical protein
MVGRTISHYRIGSQLGVGGMGVVYKAEDVRLGREVAVKFVSEDYAHDEQALQRLRSEARAASALNHPNICTIFDVGDDEGRPFIVMELMKGQTLRHRLVNGPLRVHQLVDMGIGIADALHATHADGIIHRDIKPGNIFLTDRGHVKVLDFGLAKIARRSTGSNTTGDAPDRTAAGVTLGTISYMSPEQATGEELDERTDLFSLGVVLYECATGRHPFPGKTSAVVLSAILNRAPVAPVMINPDLPIRLQEIINNCLEKDRELRYQSAADLRADLKRLRRDIESGHSRTMEVAALTKGSQHRSVAASTDGAATGESATHAKHSPWWLSAATVLVVAAVVLGGGYALWRQQSSSRVADPVSAPAAPAAAASSADDIEGRLRQARTSLVARNFRGARTAAEEVLAVDATHAEAVRIRDQAQEMLSRFDAAIGEARNRLAAGDVQGTSRAIERARELDASAPELSEISSQLSDLVRARDLSARESADRRPPRPAPQTAEAKNERTPPSSSSAQAAPPPPLQPPPGTRSVVETPPAPPASTDPPASNPGPAKPDPTAAKPEPPATKPEPAAPPPSAVEATAPKPALPAAAPPPTVTAPKPPAETAAADEAAIRRVIDTYGRAIESKDLALFRSVKPNLSPAEERRLQEGFRAVSSQRVTLTVTAIDRQGPVASVTVRRRDIIDAGGRRQTVESQQRLSLERSGSGWVITDIR